jgi:hypothetical protein
VPEITRHWQDHEKELQLKTGLVDGINETCPCSWLFKSIEHGAGISEAKLNNAYDKWEVQRATLSGKFKAYFPDAQIADNFDRPTEAITDLYALSGHH